jgi:hypothetical protein
MQAYYLTVADHDRREFTIYGPIVDDEIVLDRIRAAEASGRKLKVLNSENKNVIRELAASPSYSTHS